MRKLIGLEIILGMIAGALVAFVSIASGLKTHIGGDLLACAITTSVCKSLLNK